MPPGAAFTAACNERADSGSASEKRGAAAETRGAAGSSKGWLVLPTFHPKNRERKECDCPIFASVQRLGRLGAGPARPTRGGRAAVRRVYSSSDDCRKRCTCAQQSVENNSMTRTSMTNSVAYPLPIDKPLTACPDARGQKPRTHALHDWIFNCRRHQNFHCGRKPLLIISQRCCSRRGGPYSYPEPLGDPRSVTATIRLKQQGTSLPAASPQPTRSPTATQCAYATRGALPSGGRTLPAAAANASSLGC